MFLDEPKLQSLSIFEFEFELSRCRCLSLSLSLSFCLCLSHLISTDLAFFDCTCIQPSFVPGSVFPQCCFRLHWNCKFSQKCSIPCY